MPGMCLFRHCRLIFLMADIMELFLNFFLIDRILVADAQGNEFLIFFYNPGNL